MADLRIRMEGTARGPVRLDRRPRRPRLPRLLGAVLVLTIAGTLAGRENGGIPVPVASVNGVEVRGTRALVLVDDSGSMPDPDLQVQAQLRAIAAAGIAVGAPRFVNGSAITRDPEWSLLREFTSGVADDPDVDAVYIISDYLDYASNQRAGMDDFMAIVRRRSLRVYWATVNNDPQAPYYEIANASGGGIIPPR